MAEALALRHASARAVSPTIRLTDPAGNFLHSLGQERTLIAEIDGLSVGGTLKRYELQPPRQRYFERIRKWGAVVSLSLAASTFWGVVIAGIVKWKFGFSEVDALLFCALPTAVIFLLYFYFNRHRLARSAGFDSDM